MITVDDALAEAHTGVAVGVAARIEVVEALLTYISVLEFAVEAFVPSDQLKFICDTGADTR